MKALPPDNLDRLHDQERPLADLDNADGLRREHAGTLGKELEPGHFLFELVPSQPALAQLHKDRIGLIGQDGRRVRGLIGLVLNPLHPPRPPQMRGHLLLHSVTKTVAQQPSHASV